MANLSIMRNTMAVVNIALQIATPLQKLKSASSIDLYGLWTSEEVKSNACSAALLWNQSSSMQNSCDK